MPLNPAYDAAISGIESGGRYDALGPVTKTGDRAYGRRQVMGANIGPWTEKYYGERLSPEQFLSNPAAQDAVFQGEFGRLVEKYGPEGAAKAWFAGEKGMNNPNAKDVLGTTVQAYGQKFMQGLGQEPAASPAPQPAPAGAPMGILPAAASAAPAPQPTQGLLPSAPQSSPGLLGSQTQAPPELADLAALLQPNFRPMAPKRGLSLFRG